MARLSVRTLDNLLDPLPGPSYRVLGWGDQDGAIRILSDVSAQKVEPFREVDYARLLLVKGQPSELKRRCPTW